LNESKKPLPIEYQETRRSGMKQIGRVLEKIEKKELMRLEGKDFVEEESKPILDAFPEKKTYYKPKFEYEPKTSDDLKVGLYQPFEPLDKSTLKKNILKFEDSLQNTIIN
jgi:hypothetical protein